ncbi:MAG: hypothetical protein IKH78_10915 [Ruminococcus sp.]|nr:hypothetical protein [Ruminococcus sp.]
MSSLISDKYTEWEKICENRFQRLKNNEEELNRFFISLYGMEEELSPEVEESKITIRRADLSRDIKSLISYAIGCIFGRYSLDCDGLCYAGGKWDESLYRTIIPCRDNVMPINDIDNGLTRAVIDFIETVYGSETLEENLSFIASAIGGTGEPRDILHGYLQKSFYIDHAKMYKNRPVYWQIFSGKKGAFRGLMYMHRFTPELPLIIKENYAFPRYEQLKKEAAMLNDMLTASTGTAKSRIRREINRVQSLISEMEDFLQRLEKTAAQNIQLDLDDGVKINYSKLKDILQ